MPQSAVELGHLISLYRSMFAAREIDRVEADLVRQGEAFFHVSGAGHEATAALAMHLTDQDWLHCHYRDKALLIQRGVSPASFFHSLLCTSESHSRGRQMSAHFSDPDRKVLSMVGPVGNNALQAVGVAAAVQRRPGSPIVVCSVGDGTTQEGEFLEAVAEAVRSSLPVLFLIQDNRWAISTATRGKTLFSLPGREADTFYGLSIRRIDGRNPAAAHEPFGAVVAQMRSVRQPALIWFDCERLSDHTNADDQTLYRDLDDIAKSQAAVDPLQALEDSLRNHGSSADELTIIRDEVIAEIQAAVESGRGAAEPVPTFMAKRLLPASLQDVTQEYRGTSSERRLTMREALNGVLCHWLQSDSRVVLYGQDIEDPKGDVFGVTHSLSTLFPQRVRNSPLSESTILGVSIGRALAGERPVAFLQFADFLPIAFNQILSELGSMYWRTDGGWEAPVIVMITCGGYRPGLGPFHAQTLESIAAHVPGVDVFMPATAADAAGLLNAAFRSGRPTLFFYPKACLNLSEQSTSADVAEQLVLPGAARTVRVGEDVTFVAWGNAVFLCERAASALSEIGIAAEIIDLRSISPWDEEAVVKSAERTRQLIVVHEDNHTCGFGAEVIATVAERSAVHVNCRRVTRPDTYIPCNFANQLEVLPSFRRVLTAAAEMLKLDLTWKPEPEDESGTNSIIALGSGPADESILINEVLVKSGDAVRAGDVVVEAEATKSVVEISATVDGVVDEVFVGSGETIKVGRSLMRIRGSAPSGRKLAVSQERSGRPLLHRRKPSPNGRLMPTSHAEVSAIKANSQRVIYASRPACVTGGRVVATETLAAGIPGWTSEEAIKRTGVESRRWFDHDEDVVSLAVRASTQLLSSLGNSAPKITAILCSTTTPKEASPSVASQVATNLNGHPLLSTRVFAFDFNAACSGFLYGLRLAHDHLQMDPSACVLLLTAEVASDMLNPSDPSTVFLFGDAATATLLSAKSGQSRSLLIRTPVCTSMPDAEIAIHLPCHGASKFLRMDGIAVARTAYKAMANSVRQAAQLADIHVSDFAALIPHPGSKRILLNVANALEIDPAKVRTTLADTGNTSSSSIPLALDRFWDELSTDAPIALTAFGAGFTSAAAVAHMREVA